MTRAFESHASPHRRSRRYTGLVLLILILVLGAVAFRALGSWLVVEDPLERAGAIVVLTGGLPYRALAAEKLYEQNYAPEIWLTHPSGPEEDLAPLGVSFTPEDEYNRQVLIKSGVPADRVRVLPGAIVDTEEEVDEISTEMTRNGIREIILVTSPPHTRRVRVLWRKLAPAGLYAIVRAAPQDPYDASHWWRNTRDALAVSREILGLCNAWAGLPIRPKHR
ncbi:MAG: YdcF family protein [Candidatus Acidiferrales bacterium]